MEYTEKYVSSIDEALADETFAKKLYGAENTEEFQALFRKEKGIEIDDEIAQDAFEKIVTVRNGGELAVEDLEDVAGGFRSRFGSLINHATVCVFPISKTAISRAIASGIFNGIFHHLF